MGIPLMAPRSVLTRFGLQICRHFLDAVVMGTLERHSTYSILSPRLEEGRKNAHRVPTTKERIAGRTI